LRRFWLWTAQTVVHDVQEDLSLYPRFEMSMKTYRPLRMRQIGYTSMSWTFFSAAVFNQNFSGFQPEKI
jgi:hypothetical protein